MRRRSGVALNLRDAGFIPDVMLGHNGWGEICTRDAPMSCPASFCRASNLTANISSASSRTASL